MKIIHVKAKIIKRYYLSNLLLLVGRRTWLGTICSGVFGMIKIVRVEKYKSLSAH